MSLLRKLSIAVVPIAFTVFAVDSCYGPKNDQNIYADINNDGWKDEVYLVNSNPFHRGIYQHLTIPLNKYDEDTPTRKEIRAFRKPVLIQSSAIFDLEAITSIEVNDINNDGNKDVLYNIAQPRNPGGNTKFVLYGHGDGTFTPREGLVEDCSKPGMTWDKYGCE